MPVRVEVEDGRVTDVVGIHETPVRDPVVVASDPTDLGGVVVIDDGESWPSWRFGS